MQRRTNLEKYLIVALLLGLSTFTISNAQDYDGEAETSISGLSGLGGLSGLSALANGIVPLVSSSEIQGEVDGDGGDGSDSDSDKNSDSSDADSGDYEENAGDSSASEEHPILAKVFNLLSSVRHKRSVEEQIEAPSTNQGLKRVKRHYKGWVPYVKTYVKTDKKAHFKWGVSVYQFFLTFLILNCKY